VQWPRLSKPNQGEESHAAKVLRMGLQSRSASCFRIGDVFRHAARVLFKAYPQRRVYALPFSPSAILASLQTSTVHARNRTIGVVPVLIKKKDVNDYFAARRGRHSLSVKQTGPVAAPPKQMRGRKASSAAPVDVPGSSASTQDLHVPFFTSEPGFIDATLQAPKRWTKA